jgi:hypothetical protein
MKSTRSCGKGTVTQQDDVGCWVPEPAKYVGITVETSPKRIVIRETEQLSRKLLHVRQSHFILSASWKAENVPYISRN